MTIRAAVNWVGRVPWFFSIAVGAEFRTMTAPSRCVKVSHDLSVAKRCYADTRRY